MKVGVIGMGSIGSRHTHNLGGLGHEVLPYDINGKYLTFEEVRNKADAYVIATPISDHANKIEVLRADKKPIFVEKPLADHLNVLTDQVIMVGYNLRFHSCVLKAKGWVDGGFLGSVHWANFVCGQLNRKYKEHVILNWSHEIDLALYLLGPAWVKFGIANPKGSIAEVIINHHGGWLSTIHLDYVTEPEIRQFIIVGNKASIIVDLKARYAWLRDASGTMLEHFEGQDDWDDNYVDEMETFIARCEGMNTAGATAEDGLAVSKICLKAMELASVRASENT